MRAIRKHMRDFLAILALIVLALAATVAILVKQGQPIPSWVPGFGEDRFELRAEFTSAQAVTPGQGQSVDIAGIKVGEVEDVSLESGTAVVTMGVEPKYAELIHRDATLLLRPRTGLQDMTLQLEPGESGPQMPEGSTVQMADTTSPVQPDQILASLDADTRDYLKLLLQGGAKGLGSNGEAFSATLRRLEPTARDLAKLNGALAHRRQNISRVITNLKLVSEELGSSDTHLSEFVGSSNRALAAFADQSSSLRSALDEFPGALSSTRRGLHSAGLLADVLGPSSRALLPSARALAPALRQTRPFFRQTTPAIRDQIRPFTVQARPPIRTLADTSRALRHATPDVTSSLRRVNELLNSLAYNPPGKREGALFYGAWLAHDTNSVFSLQDAQGPIRRGLALESCQTAVNADALTGGVASLRTVVRLSGVPSDNAGPGRATVTNGSSPEFICDPSRNP